MWYVLEDTIPKSTTYANRRETTIKVGGGILHTIYVIIPPGCVDLVHLQLRAASYFILPRNEDKDISGEQDPVEYKEWLKLKAAENNLTLITWNEDTKYDHKVKLMIGILPKTVAEIEEMFMHDLRLFLRLFRRRT